MTFEELPKKGKMIYADLVEILEQLNATPNGEYGNWCPDTNGWQVDYWMPFILGDKNYMLSGSMWYGNYAIEEE